MEETEKRYAIGEQSFPLLRKSGALYVDKTMFIHKIVTSKSKYYFLARPRRFGKSLFLSTLKSFFEGDRDLFKGLYIDSTDWNWEAYPVFRLDLNKDRYSDVTALDSVLNKMFSEWEDKYGVRTIYPTFPQRFEAIIQAAYHMTGKEVVILVDEYDKALVDNLNKEDNFEAYRNKLASIYTILKSGADYIRLVFLTGVTRFSKLSVFSDLNNLRDITFSNEYADLCGISEKELKTDFKEGIAAMAAKNDWSYDETLRRLKENYDGYRFAEEGSEMYNPWSLLSAMQDEKIGNYWNRTGFPTVVVESLKRINVDLEKYFNSECSQEALMGLDLANPRPLALLYQAGYLTIKGYDPEFALYQIGIPNKEVKEGLFTLLLPYYTSLDGTDTQFFIGSFVRDLRRGDVEGFMERLLSLFASIPYDMDLGNERNFHNVIYVFMTLVGLHVKTEVRTSSGRIDLLCTTDRFIYIIELKYDGTAREALDQIEAKSYALPFKADKREIIRIGVSFSSKERRITDWEEARGATRR